MRVLITGGAGFIGSNLAQALLVEGTGDSVIIMDDLSTGRRKNIEGLDVEFVEGSILDYATLVDVSRGVDAVVHLAAIPSVPRSLVNPRASHDANTTGTLNVLEAAREVTIEHVIVASSSSVYGSNPKLPKSEYDWTRPMSPYAVSKQAAEGYALAYQFSYGLRTLAFRFFNVYGPGQSVGHAYAAVIPRFIDAILNHQPVQVHGDGTQSRDFTYVGTVCAVIVDALHRRVSSTDPVNLAFGTNTTLLELLGALERLFGREVVREFVESRTGDVKASQAASSRLITLFPGVQPVKLEDGLVDTLDWYRGQLDFD